MFELVVFNGMVGGFLAILGMFIVELTAFLKWGDHGVQEKQLSTMLVHIILRRSIDPDQKESISVRLIAVSLHFLAGIIIGVILSLFMLILPETIPIVYITFLFSLILQFFGVLVFERITKVPAISESLGFTPILVNTFAHIIFGLILGLWLASM